MSGFLKFVEGIYKIDSGETSRIDESQKRDYATYCAIAKTVEKDGFVFFSKSEEDQNDILKNALLNEGVLKKNSSDGRQEFADGSIPSCNLSKIACYMVSLYAMAQRDIIKNDPLDVNGKQLVEDWQKKFNECHNTFEKARICADFLRKVSKTSSTSDVVKVSPSNIVTRCRAER